MREDEQAAYFLQQIITQHSSNDSTSSNSSTMKSHKRKACTDYYSPVSKKPKGSRNVKQDSISNAAKMCDSVEEYIRRQDETKSFVTKCQTSISNLKRALQEVQSDEKSWEKPKTKSNLSNLATSVAQTIAGMQNDIRNCDFDSCIFCKNESNSPRAISKKCGHGFCCMNCILKYWDFVYGENGGCVLCLKCKLQYYDDCNCQIGSRYVIIG
ncbi:hypothetical protein DPMN_052714 [Dreissena polymorpha]|uniref:RING-type domain-containing protein n=1 Tax=Dreissena polymorpha TaxID=45954 RepID=A0A9D4CKX1_DREPO|nr:hypothetical protein DPMN_052714 [Dreissena polymorpha]